MGYPGDPDTTWEVLDAMEQSSRQLWSDKDSVANLARLAKQQVLEYLAQQSPVQQREIEDQFNSLKSRTYVQVLIPLILSLVVAAPTFVFLRRRFSGWVRDLGNFSWSGNLFQRRVMGPLLIGSTVSLAVATGSLVLILWDLRDMLQFYQLNSLGFPGIAESLAYAVIPIAGLVVVLDIVNAATSRGRVYSGLGVLCLLVAGFLALLLGWGLTAFAFLSYP
jgi:hypothetical protein